MLFSKVEAERLLGTGRACRARTLPRPAAPRLEQSQSTTEACGVTAEHVSP